jgi:4-nitrophenyl phosphatase
MEFAGASKHARLTYIFDLDGVIYRGSEPQMHSRETILALKERGEIVRYYTNNSALTRRDYADKLASMGIEASVDQIMTSSYATALYFLERGAVGRTVYKIGEKGIQEELEAVGMRVLQDEEAPGEKIDFVVVGIDRNFHYRKLARAQAAIFAGAEFIATNEDATFPVEGGGLLPGGGCMVAALRTATGVEPFVVGKPSTYAFDRILDLTNTPPDRAVMVGDRLDTDILVGNRAGAHTVLVLTGVSSREDVARAQGELRPDRVIKTLAELL